RLRLFSIRNAYADAMAARWASTGYQVRSNRVILILMPTHKLSPEILNAAISGFEQQKLRIDAQIAELRAMLAGDSAKPTTAPETPKRKISAAARRRMALGQRARWAK